MCEMWAGISQKCKKNVSGMLINLKLLYLLLKKTLQKKYEDVTSDTSSKKALKDEVAIYVNIFAIWNILHTKFFYHCSIIHNRVQKK